MMWTELVRRWYPEDDFRWDMLGVREYYQSKAEIARRLRPRSICELGVRAGYSLFAMLYDLPLDTVVVGIDKNVLGLSWQEEHMWKLLEGRQFTFYNEDTSLLRKLMGPFDLVHVDADHSYEGCLADLEASLEVARYILVDDFDVQAGGEGIRQACAEVLARTGRRSVHIPDPLRGQLLILPE